MSVEHDDITVLISARRNSKYLAKFLFGLMERTTQLARLDVRIMLNTHDTWNNELESYFAAYVHPSGHRPFTFVRENMQLGRAGLAHYFNELLKHGKVNPWTIYFCEDHFITLRGWDRYLRDVIDGSNKQGESEGKTFPLNPNDVWVIVPKFDNCGAMNHILSAGFIYGLGNKLGNHGWIDSYINDLMRDYQERVIRMDDEMLHDFTHDKPSPMDDSHMQGVVSLRGKAMPPYKSSTTRHRIAMDAELIKRKIEKEARS